MQKLGDQSIYSASDLVGYLECEEMCLANPLCRFVAVASEQRPH